METQRMTRTFMFGIVVLLLACLFVSSPSAVQAQDPTETFEVTTIDGVPTPIRIVMKDLQAKTSTVQQIDNVKYDGEIPDALFDPMKLPAAADSPLWQPSGAQAAAGK